MSTTGSTTSVTSSTGRPRRRPRRGRRRRSRRRPPAPARRSVATRRRRRQRPDQRGHGHLRLQAGFRQRDPANVDPHTPHRWRGRLDTDARSDVADPGIEADVEPDDLSSLSCRRRAVRRRRECARWQRRRRRSGRARRERARPCRHPARRRSRPLGVASTPIASSPRSSSRRSPPPIRDGRRRRSAPLRRSRSPASCTDSSPPTSVATTGAACERRRCWERDPRRQQPGDRGERRRGRPEQPRRDAPAQPHADERGTTGPGKRGRSQRAQPAVDELQLAFRLGALATPGEVGGDAALLASTRRSTDGAGQRATYPRGTPAVSKAARRGRRGTARPVRCGPASPLPPPLGCRRGALGDLGVAEPLDLRHPQHLAQVRRKRVEGLLQHGPLLEIVLLVVDDVEVVARRLTTASTAAPAARGTPAGPSAGRTARSRRLVPSRDGSPGTLPRTPRRPRRQRLRRCRAATQPTDGPPGVAPVEHGVGVGVAAPQALKDRGVGLPGT